MQRLREEFLSGNIRICKSRIHNLGCNRNFDRFKDKAELSVIQQRSPLRLDLRLNGQCNLACIMCDVWQQPNQVYDESNFWREGPKAFFPFLMEIEVLGGEPFVQKDTFRLIREVSAVNDKCTWSFVTNGHYSGHKKIIDALAALKIGSIQVSVDSLNPAVYNKIRRGGDLELPLGSIAKFSEFRRKRQSLGIGFRFVLSMCILKQNWQEIPDFLEFCASWEAEPDLQFAFYDPSQESSLLYCSKSQRQEIYDATLAKVNPAQRDMVERALLPIRGK
jgi:cyclic pyranopterin phosphate synthase